MNALAFCPTCRKDTPFEKGEKSSRCQVCGFEYAMHSADEALAAGSGASQSLHILGKIFGGIVMVTLILAGVAALGLAVLFVGCLLMR